MTFYGMVPYALLKLKGGNCKLTSMGDLCLTQRCIFLVPYNLKWVGVTWIGGCQSLNERWAVSLEFKDFLGENDSNESPKNHPGL